MQYCTRKHRLHVGIIICVFFFNNERKTKKKIYWKFLNLFNDKEKRERKRVKDKRLRKKQNEMKFIIHWHWFTLLFLSLLLLCFFPSKILVRFLWRYCNGYLIDSHNHTKEILQMIFNFERKIWICHREKNKQE